MSTVAMRFDDLPDWSFDAEGVSMCMYGVRGKSNRGWTIEFSSAEQDDIFADARKAAHATEASNGTNSS